MELNQQAGTKNQVLLVAFDDSKTDIHKIQKAVAIAGNDTEMHRASDEAYDQLHGCCKYERMAEKANKSTGQELPESGSARNHNPAGCCGSE